MKWNTSSWHPIKISLNVSSLWLTFKRFFLNEKNVLKLKKIKLHGPMIYKPTSCKCPIRLISFKFLQNEITMLEIKSLATYYALREVWRLFEFEEELLSK